MILRVFAPMMVRMTMRMVVRTFVSRGWRLGGFCGALEGFAFFIARL